MTITNQHTIRFRRDGVWEEHVITGEFTNKRDADESARMVNAAIDLILGDAMVHKSDSRPLFDRTEIVVEAVR